MFHPHRRNDGAVYSEINRRPTTPLAKGGDVERSLVAGVNDPIGPALRYDLVLGPKAHAFLAVLADVAEARALPPAEAVVGDRHRNRHVDPDHPDIDARGEFPRRM